MAELTHRPCLMVEKGSQVTHLIAPSLPGQEHIDPTTLKRFTKSAGSQGNAGRTILPRFLQLALHATLRSIPDLHHASSPDDM